MSAFAYFVGAIIGACLYYSYSRFFSQVTDPLSSLPDHFAPNSRFATTQGTSLPRGISRESACELLKAKFDISSPARLAVLSDSVKHHWASLSCESVASASNAAPLISTSTPVQSHFKTVAPFNSFSKSLQPPIAPPPPPPPPSSLARDQSTTRDSEFVKTKCLFFKSEYHVEPGTSWGTLSIEQQKEWSKLKCDEYVDESSSSSAGIAPPPRQVPSTDASANLQGVTAEDMKKVLQKVDKKKQKDSKTAPLENTALPSVSEESAEWCVQNRDKYAVVPMKSWGRLPMNMVDIWKQRNCDLIFTAARMVKKAITKCYGNESVLLFDGTTVKSAVTGGKQLPLIAIMAATTTRKVVNPSPQNMALFTYLLPSLIRTLDCGFRYEYVLGYDVGDPFYDTAEGMSQTKRWFRDNIEEPMKKNGISLQLRPVKVNNSVKKPGPVFLAMARAAYEAGADYFYRINDDTELAARWPIIFVRSLHSLSVPFGVVGPVCNQGNQKILTHDFVHRLHMDIFEMNYYPPKLVDWWMDDWISLVYGLQRTFKAQEVPVVHHTGAHGQRYEVDRENERLLVTLVEEGRLKIRQWMLKNQVSDETLAAFDSDVYKAGFEHRDVPGSTASPKPHKRSEADRLRAGGGGGGGGGAGIGSNVWGQEVERGGGGGGRMGGRGRGGRGRGGRGRGGGGGGQGRV